MNILDFYFAKEKNYGKIKMQLPSFLRAFNQNFLERTISLGNAKFLLPCVFLAGIVVSAGEFLCTGQVYLATILYLIQNNLDVLFGILLLVLYIIFACLPLFIIIVLVWKGRKVLAISEFIRAKLPLIKLITGIFFAIFAVYLLLKIL